jgi:hypothetical protein
MKISIITKRAILKKMCVDNNVNPNNVYIDKKFGYIKTVDFDQKDVDFRSTTFNDVEYVCKYQSGCFYPFLFIKERNEILN